MAEFNIRSESVDVEQIMKQIRARIREKRGADYTEDQIRELATVRLETFLDPKNLRSDLLEQFRKTRPALPEPPKEPPPVEPPYLFDDQTLFASHRAPLRMIRALLKPILKLFFNPNTLNQILSMQAQFNLDMLKRDVRRRVELQQQISSFERSRGEWNVLYYEVLHNLVLETTRTGVEVKNLKMRLESLASRLDFSERRVRALEGVVQYRPEAVRRSERGEGRDRRPEADSAEGVVPAEAVPGDPAGAQPAAGEGARRRRRRRRGRRGTGLPPGAGPSPGAPTGEAQEGQSEAEPSFDAESGSAEDDGFDSGEDVTRDDETAEGGEGGESPDSGGGPDDDPSTLREPQGRPEPGRGTTSSGSSRDPSRDEQQ